MNPPSTPTDAPAESRLDALALDQAEVDLVASEAAGPAALRGSVLLGGGYAATIGLSLISAPLLIRHLGISDFGRYTTVLALVTVVNGLTDAGLMNIALREWASRSRRGSGAVHAQSAGHPTGAERGGRRRGRPVRAGGGL